MSEHEAAHSEEEFRIEIRDEFDEEEVPKIRKVNENHYIIDGNFGGDDEDS